MKPNEQISNHDNSSLLEDLGENYHYLKTIISNRLEITKLEFSQKVIHLSQTLITIIFAVFLSMIVLALLLAAMVIFIEGLTGSLLSAILIVVSIVILSSLCLYFLLRKKISKIIEKKLRSLF